MFAYTAAARARGFKDILFGLALSGVSGCFIYLFVIAQEAALLMLVYGVACGIFFLCGMVFLLGGLARVVMGGYWHIQISPDKLSWQAPRVAESSFELAPDEVACIERRVRIKTKRDGRVKEKTKYYLVSRHGQEYHLTHQSGVDVEAFVREAQRVGVELVELRLEKT